MSEKHIRRKRILKHLGKISLALLTVSLMTSPASAVDSAEAASQVIGSEGGKRAAREAVSGALKIAKSKPAMTMATGIVCLACVPVAGAVASPGMCIACGILIAKTFG